MLQALERADEEGLNAADYRFATKPDFIDPQEAARSDIDLSRAFLKYISDVRTGRVAPASVYPDTDMPAQPFDNAAALDAVLGNETPSDFMSELPPQWPGYAFLRTALARYRQILAGGGWEQTPDAKGPVSYLPPAARQALWKRLSLEDPDGTRHTEQASIPELQTALERFQSRQGLEADGKLGPRTVEALNITVAERIARIEANMERWRWLPHIPPRRFVAVNVPAASLSIVDNFRTVLSSSIIVGKPATPTPILATSIVAVTANPPWNVPQSIAKKELLPKLIRNPGYLATQNMILRDGPPQDPQGLRINWQNISPARFPYRIQQLPGPKNSLGELKMEMPNRFDVYLHDTPAKSLFAQPERFFSHGCVRVQQVGALAKYALTGDPAADVARIIHPADDKTEHLALAAPLPVYILYWTAFQNADGTVAFRRDVYGRDRRLISILAGSHIASAARVPQANCNV